VKKVTRKATKPAPKKLKRREFPYQLVYRFTKTYPNYPVVRASNFFHR
jgi:hypothetical protein